MMANEKDAPEIAIMRSELGRARGLGAAKSGLHHWWAQRLTAVALVPLSLWFVWSVLSLAGAPHAAVIDWMASPLRMAFLLALIAATFHHMQLGLQTVIEDYVHGEACRLASLLAMKAASVLLALAAVVSVLRLGL
jgi:succinate dehydrogenase / fumarate reductase, membrane anchor subunit